MKKFINESWLVVMMGLVFGCLLAGAQTMFAPQIKINVARAFNEAVQKVVPDLDPEKKPEKLEIDGNDVYRCLKSDGTLAGWAVDATGGGFVDKIRIVVGVSPNGGEILGINVVSHIETPGLGNKIDTKGTANFYPLQYPGKSTAVTLELTKLTPSKPNEIQAITGATYSSEYTMDIVNDVLARIVPLLPKE